METLEKNTIDINNFKLIPHNIGLGFGFCIYGDINENVLEFAKKCNFKIVPQLSENGKKYTNFFPTDNTDFSKMFSEFKPFKYMDGFSPNLNKNLHIGHFSNLVLAKSFQSLEVANDYVSLLGDAMIGDVSKDNALAKFYDYCKTFNYKVDKVFFAYEMKCDESKFVDGADEYEGAKVVESGTNKIVAIKKDGSTSYFYQDIALASKLNSETLYLTGYEQGNHFKLLKGIFPQITHIGLGLVKLQEKMSSRLGNVIYIDDLMNDLKKEFNNDEQLCYNVFAGYILKSNPQSDKKLEMDTIKNPKNSPGLYLSYTMARLKSAGAILKYNDEFIKQSLQFHYLKAKHTLNPSCLFSELTELCKEINKLYDTHKIAGNEKNKQIFELLLSDLALGMKKLGLFEVEKV